MGFKVGDKVKLIKNECGSENKVGDVGYIVEIDDYYYGLDGSPITYKVDVDDGADDCNWSFETDLEFIYSENVYQKQVDNLEASMDSYKDKSTCKHDWIVVGMGLYGDYINCKHCDMKKEDYVEEDESDVDDLIRSYFTILEVE